jgi:hypothetical protein
MKPIRNWKASKRVDGKSGRSNQDRADCAKVALDAYGIAKEGREAYDSVEACLSDLLADIYHYSASQGIDPTKIAELAVIHFESER